ncbi:tannase-domain-containing protein [Meira miltonrushii]|uniref:Carboxylic ester hydrolase n=1 Tax=Meira miltonrushii TaxID=1280837 RepID=A0A316VDQ7_9BASI|nr:tannase-domain-containing protein [Meira miltonrushii]PWN35620.1 tannase-domain-containing protein [Meira miltonrushii]
MNLTATFRGALLLTATWLASYSAGIHPHPGVHAQVTGLTAGTKAETLCKQLGQTFQAPAGLTINNTFSQYFPEGSTLSLEDLTKLYPNGTIPDNVPIDKVLDGVGPDLNIKAQAGYGRLASRISFNGPVGGLPAFCRFGLQIATSPVTSVLTEVWLPLAGTGDPGTPTTGKPNKKRDNTSKIQSLQGDQILGSNKGWNGRIAVMGHGGQLGYVPLVSMKQYMGRYMFAVAGTNLGHFSVQNGVSSWVNGTQFNETLTDFASRANHVTLLVAEKAVNQFYGISQGKRNPKENNRVYRYYLGSSVGGARGLSAAQVYPDDFDGIMAGCPAINFMQMNTAQLATSSVHNKTTPIGKTGFFTRGALVGPIKDVVLQQCDGLDGVVDGVISDPSKCKPQLEKELLCGTNTKYGKTNATCLTQDQIKASQMGYGRLNNSASMNGPDGGLPAFCRFGAKIQTSPMTSIVSEVWLPLESNPSIPLAPPPKDFPTGTSPFTISENGTFNAVTSQCDALDGVVDGIISAPQQCKPQLNALLCGTSTTYGKSPSTCLTPLQISTAYQLYNSTIIDGQEVYPAYWPGLADSASQLKGTNGKASGWYQLVTLQEPHLSSSFDPYRDITYAALQKGNAVNPGGVNAVQTDLSEFVKNNGKMILYHGTYDLVISPQSTVNYFNDARNATASAMQVQPTEIDNSLKFYIIYGMRHTRQGPGAINFGGAAQNDPGSRPYKFETAYDISLAIIAWAEKSIEPNAQVAAAYQNRQGVLPSSNGDEMEDNAQVPTTQQVYAGGLINTRLLCPYPLNAQYQNGQNATGENGYQAFQCS